MIFRIVPHRGLFIASRFDGGLQASRAGHRPGEHARAKEIGYIHESGHQQGGTPAGQNRKHCQNVGLDAERTGQPPEEFSPVLNANTIKEQDQTDKTGRGGFRRDRPDRDPDEKYRTDSKRKPANVDLADGISQSDDKKQGDKRLSVKKCTDGFHHTAPSFN